MKDLKLDLKPQDTLLPTSGHIPNTFQSTSKHQPTSLRHLPENSQSPRKHLAKTLQNNSYSDQLKFSSVCNFGVDFDNNLFVFFLPW